MSASSARLNMLMQECNLRKDVSGALDAFNNYQASHCYHRRKICIFDSHTQTYRKIYVPCGTCYHCKETKINSWVTRMYAHLEDFKHVYFVTLTYRSFTPRYNEYGEPFLKPVEHLLLDKLSSAVWHLDAKNSLKHLSYNPCLLIKKHYQDFFKRLRKNTGLNDITYVISGEYGKKFARPHFHAIIFSNSEISPNDIRRAWSVSLWRDNSSLSWSYKRNQRYNGVAYDFPIGNIDFHDLVSNGTLNTTAKVKVEGSYMNASQCFSYVCKYVCKSDDANLDRVKLAYNNLFTDQEFVNDPELGIVPFSVSQERARIIGLSDYYINNLKSQSFYEKIPFPSFDIVGRIDYGKTQDFPCKTLYLSNYPHHFYDFRKAFAPFVEFSRGTPIGSIYASTHLSEFTQGVYNKPLLQNAGFVVPSYFRNKAKFQLYGLRKMRKTISGTSYPKTGLKDLLRRLDVSAFSDVPLAECVPYFQTAKDYSELLKNDAYVFRELELGANTLLLCDRAISFRYNRHTRTYDKVRQIPIADWINMQLQKLLRDFHQYHCDMRELAQTETERKLALNALVRTTKRSLRSLHDDFVTNQINFLKNKQRAYDTIHKSVE